MLLLRFFSTTIRGVPKLKKPFFMIFQKTHFDAIFFNFFANKWSKKFCVAGF